jgi:hypothetical protein
MIQLKYEATFGAPLLQVFADIARRYPGILLHRPSVVSHEGIRPISVEEHAAELAEALQTESPAVRASASGQNWKWGYDDQGFVNIVYSIPEDPGPYVYFEEWQGGGPPTGRPSLGASKRRLEFGHQPPKGAKVAWGARAIFKPISKNPMIDILWDRQSAFGEEAERQTLVEWVKTTGLPWLNAELEEKAGYATSKSHEIYRYEDGDYVIEASPKGSGGYLYIGAWKK